ncbi:Spermidine/putrescine transport system permease protein PotB [Defluviimonas aquaemixtae]|uniref:Spermidine/putrescine transport system permease protein PotB n=1 Tax=Albidovulum aquaemixtae TaxID=1542388 RepID=A0A2R8B3T5_9RHOB|nr:ABC transporter permease [Defluviimonas aquaemixtae]SPH17257.1 Spermidine/putrescine transport system permease protein PotB [Defluviimonas aquaemixtae]
MSAGSTRTGLSLLSPAFLVMAATLLAPVVALVVMSFWSQSGFDIDRSFTLKNYAQLVRPGEGVVWYGIRFPFAYPVPAVLMVKSLAMSLVATICVIGVAWPMAYFLAFRVTRNKAMWIILLTIPFWTSYLLRVFSWKIVLGFNGAINSGLMWLGVIDAPLEFLLYNPIAVMITLAHSWIAFAVLPIYVSLEKIDRSLLEAASDLGDSRWARFRRITLPLSMPGTIAATLLVFIPTVGDYVTPTLVGGPGGTMIGSLIQQLFLRQDNAPLGAAISIVMMLIIAAFVGLFLWLIGYGRMRRRVG